jgi:hypothetical protein
VAGLEGDAAFRLDVLQFVDAGEMLVDQHRVGQWPEVLGRLQLGRVRWQEQQVDMVGDA